MTHDADFYLAHSEKGFQDKKGREEGTHKFDAGKVTEQNYWTPE